MASNLRAARDMALAAQPIDRNVTTPSRPWRRAVTSPPVLAWVAHLIIVLPTAAVTVALTPDRDDDRQRFSQPGRYLISPLSTWDGGWYVRIARDGYDQVEESAAFWPLYPLLIDLGQTITGWSYESAGVLLSNLLFLGALAALFRLVRTSYGSAIASRAVWPIASSRSPPSGGIPAVVRRAVSAWIAIVETWWATTSCSSRAIRARSSSAACSARSSLT